MSKYNTGPTKFDRLVEEFKIKLIVKSLKKHKFNISATSRELGLSRGTIYTIIGMNRRSLMIDKVGQQIVEYVNGRNL